MRRALTVVAMAVVAVGLWVAGAFRGNERYWYPASVGLIALLLVTAPVAAQSGQLAVASSHTTANDFNAADTLENVSVVGTGSAASVELNQWPGQDAGGTHRYPFEGSASDIWGTADGTDQSSAGYVSGIVGSQAKDFDGQDDRVELPDLGLNNSQEITIAGWIRKESDHDATLIGRSNEGSNIIDVRALDSSLGRQAQAIVGDSGANNHLLRGGTVSENTWTHITYTFDPNGPTSRLYVNGTEVDNETGAIDDFAAGDGPWIGARSDSDKWLDGHADDVRLYNSVLSQTQITNLQDTDVGDRGQYISANHSVGSAELGWVNRTLDNASLIAEWQYHDGSAWQVANSTTYTSTGNSTLDISGISSDTWRLNATFQNESGPTTAQLHDEGILVRANPPTIDNANPSPADGASLSSRSTTLSIPVNDSDFASATLDEQLTVEFFVQPPGSSSFSSVGSDTLNSNGTASTGYTASTNGTHQWYANATDNFSLRDQSNTFTFDAPMTAGFLHLEPMDPTSSITSGLVLTLQATESESSSAALPLSSGNVFNLSDAANVSISEEHVAIVEDTASTPRWYDRRLLLDDLAGNETMYLLDQNDTAPTNVRFQLSDQTGLYPPDESDLFIRRSRIFDPFSGASEWITSTSEQFGANGFEPILQEGIRYRLSIRNDDGDRRMMGYFVPTLNETVTLEVDGISFGTVGDQGYRWEAYIEEVQQTVGGNTTTVDRLTWEYLDPEDKTSELTVTVYERNNESNVLVQNSYQDLGEAAIMQTLTQNQSGKAWVVEINGTRDGGNITGRMLVGSTTLDPGLGLSPFWQQLIAMGTLLVVGAALGGLRDPSIAAIGVSLASGIFFFAGFFNGAVSGLAILVALFVGVLHRVALSGGGVVPGS